MAMTFRANSLCKTIRVALAQISTPLGDVQNNKDKIIDAISRAEEAEADIVMTPELATLGYGSGDIYLDKVDENLEAMDEIVKSTVGKRTWAIVGFVEKDRLGFFYNSAALISNGEIRGIYRKVQLVNYRLFDEKRYFRPGSRLPVFDTPFGKIGILICEDVWFPEPARGLTFRGAEVIFVLSASPYARGKPKRWEDFLRERTYDNILPFVFTNMAGVHDGVTYWGGSMVMSAAGKLIAQARLLDEDFITVELDLKEAQRLRRRDIRVREVRREILEEVLKAFSESQNFV